MRGKGRWQLPLVDKPDTSRAEKEWLNQATIRMYDPPVDGKTPADGAGLPATSACYLRDWETQQEQGFTLDVVGWEGKWQTLGNFPVIPGTPFTPIQEAEPEKNPEKPKGTVTSKQTRTRTIYEQAF